MTELKIYSTPEMVALEFADFFYDLFVEYHKEEKTMHIALSGGTTPKLWFKLLVEKYRDIINWDIIHFYWGDERMVPSNDADSNYGEAKRLLFDKISIPNMNIHPINGSNKHSDEIRDYTELLYENLEKEEGMPVFDLIVLGMGDDGHTASIFPNQIELFNSDNLYALTYHPKTGQPRLTVTGKVINRARNVAFLITGNNKAPVLRSVFNQENNFEEYPASYVQPLSNQLYFFVDSEAAQQMF
jgi:6-phosphogluconolactonase